MDLHGGPMARPRKLEKPKRKYTRRTESAANPKSVRISEYEFLLLNTYITASAQILEKLLRTL